MRRFTKSRFWRALWYWGPPLITMALLFIASAQPRHKPPDEWTWLYFSGLMPVFTGPLGIVELLLKKGAHMAVYGMLAMLLMRALVAQGMTPRRAGYLAIALTVCYAVTDELHQAFVPGRSASGVDVGFDFLGAGAFTLLARRHHDQRKATPPHENPRAALERLPYSTP